MTTIKMLLAALALVLTAGAAHAEPYDLRGIKLGMSLAEFRNTPFPDPEKYKEKVNIYCTGESSSGTVRGTLYVNAMETKLGVLACNFFTLYRGEQNYTRVMDANMDVAGVGVYTVFSFAPSRTDRTMRLFRISIRSNMESWDQFYSAYTTKFGKPTDVQTRQVQNGMGAVFDKVTAVWANPESTITLEQRTEGKVFLMGITYLLKDMAADLRQQTEAIQGKPADKL